MTGGRENIIELRGVMTRFGEKVVHRDVGFSVRRGTVVGLIGGSGTGKTVLLREILGLHRPDAGSIRVMSREVVGLDAEGLNELRKGYGVLFQGGALFSALTVFENVAAPIVEALKLPPRLLRLVVNLRLRLSGLSEDAGSKMPSELSGGMIKRAAIARALALEPELLFLDEPTSGLDPITARGIDRLVRSLADNLGVTVLVVTHDVETLRSVTDKIVVLYDGVVLADGPYRQVASTDHPWIHEYFMEESRH